MPPNVGTPGTAEPLHAIINKMKSAYIVKESVKRNPLRPKEVVKESEFLRLVDNSDKLIWLEHTEHGKEWDKVNPIKRRKVAYLNYNQNDESSFVRLSLTQFGYIAIQFDFKSTNENLHDLISLAINIRCNLWQYKPKRRVLTHEIVNERYKRKGPVRRPQTEIKSPINWIYVEGNIEEFSIYNRINFERSKATVSKINKSISNSCILGLECENNRFYIIGEGIRNLYVSPYKLRNGESFQSQRMRYEKRMMNLFKDVVFKNMLNDTDEKYYNDRIKNKLDELVKTKGNILFTKVAKMH